MRPLPITAFAAAALLAIGISLPLGESTAFASGSQAGMASPPPPKTPQAGRPQATTHPPTPTVHARPTVSDPDPARTPGNPSP
jgi:hypothetical protein